jgi:endonuclease/exonuclease/phosphatase (EEP) superfamily protein YafD
MNSRKLARPLALLTGAACFATVLAYGGRWSWVCDLLVNFRVHFAMLLGLALVPAIAIRSWRIASIAAIGIALNVWPMYGAFSAPAAPPVPNARPVRVAAFNVHISNDRMREIAVYLESLSADIVVLEEMTLAHAEEVAALLPGLPHRYFAEQGGVWGVVVLSRWPMASPQPVKSESRRFAARIDFDLGDRKVRLYGAHLNWPVMPATASLRNSQIEVLGRELSDCPHACVAVGDFNVTPWSSHFRDVLESPGVHDCAAGRGLLGTWPSGLPAVLRIRIDQCLIAGAVSVAEVRVGEGVGSDHAATINDLLIGGP